MQINYLTEKPNTYRYGVFMGNYVEEVYAKDNQGKQIVGNNYPLSETQEQFSESALKRQVQKTFQDEENVQDIDMEDMDVYDPLKATKLLYKYDQQKEQKKDDDNLRFQTSYALSYEYGVQPQHFTRNDIHGDFKSTNQITKKKLNDETLRLERENQPQKEEVVQKHNKKNQHFSRTFDKPHLSVGFRL